MSKINEYESSMTHADMLELAFEALQMLVEHVDLVGNRKEIARLLHDADYYPDFLAKLELPHEVRALIPRLISSYELSHYSVLSHLHSLDLKSKFEGISTSVHYRAGALITDGYERSLSVVEQILRYEFSRPIAMFGLWTIFSSLLPYRTLKLAVPERPLDWIWYLSVIEFGQHHAMLLLDQDFTPIAARISDTASVDRGIRQLIYEGVSVRRERVWAPRSQNGLVARFPVQLVTNSPYLDLIAPICTALKIELTQTQTLPEESISWIFDFPEPILATPAADREAWFTAYLLQKFDTTPIHERINCRSRALELGGLFSDMADTITVLRDMLPLYPAEVNDDVVVYNGRTWRDDDGILAIWPETNVMIRPSLDDPQRAWVYSGNDFLCAVTANIGEEFA